MKILAICGSPRKGNTEFMLNKVLENAEGEKELILLKELDIKHCMGCLGCDKTNKCVIQDDMQKLYPKLTDCDILVIGTPNYFNNVPGLLKDFIDRTNPFYETDTLKGKKVVVLVVGGDEKAKTQKVIDQAINYFIRAHNMKLIGSLCAKALEKGKIEEDKETIQQCIELGKKIK